jgi:hypothetical protein
MNNSRRVEHLLEAVNSLDDETRRKVVAAIREHDPECYYFTDARTGRVSLAGGRIAW